MILIALLVAAVLYIVLIKSLRAHNVGAKVIKCFSSSCSSNLKGFCKRKTITMYDNGALGICLNHSVDMTTRVLEPLLKGIELGKQDGEVQALGKMAKLLDEHKEDVSLIKDGEAFSKWLKNLLQN